MNLSREDLLVSSLHAIRKLGGSATNSEQPQEVVTALQTRPDDAAELQTGSRTKLDYELAWAQREALRPGAPPVDLVDGDSLAEKMRALNLGVETALIEEVTLDESFLKSLEP